MFNYFDNLRRSEWNLEVSYVGGLHGCVALLQYFVEIATLNFPTERPLSRDSSRWDDRLLPTFDQVPVHLFSVLEMNSGINHERSRSTPNRE
jgi:hypothetical protein